MSEPVKFRLTPRPHRRGTKTETRERLLQAALELLERGGETAVTTVSVTQAAGFVQSAFYPHFSSAKQCVVAAAERVTSDIREAVAQARRHMYDVGPGEGEDLIQFNLKIFQVAEQHRHVVKLFLRYRSDPLALDGVMHRFARDLTADLAIQLQEQLQKAGATTVPSDWNERLADCLMGASLSAIEAHLDGRAIPAREHAELLATFGAGACAAAYGSMISQAPEATGGNDRQE